MKTYISLFILRFKYSIQYRAAALAGISTQFFFGFVFISVYLAFYNSNGASAVPMEWQALVNYLWLNQAFYALVNTWFKDRDLLSMIKNGNIAYEFVRPINFYKKWFATMFGNRLSSVLLRCIPVLVIAFILPEPFRMGPPASLASFLLFILAMILSSLIINAFTMIYHLISMYTLDEKGVMALIAVIGEIFAGGTVPIAFFPNFLQKIAYVLPFRYICDLPFRIYSGVTSVSSSIPELLLGFTWLVILLVIGNLISNNATKKALIQGG